MITVKWLKENNYLEILERIIEIRKEQYFSDTDTLSESSYLSGLFTWSNTEEGHDFWSEMDATKNVEPFYELYKKVDRELVKKYRKFYKVNRIPVNISEEHVKSMIENGFEDLLQNRKVSP